MKALLVTIVIGPVIFALTLLLPIGYATERDNMVRSVEELFQQATQARGERYRQIRSQILDLDESQAASVQAYLNDPDWRKRLQAEILEGWREKSERYQYIRSVAKGQHPELKPEKYLTGQPSVDVPAGLIISLGPSYAPALLELFYKEDDIVDEYTYLVCISALTAWQYKRAVPVFREILKTPDFSADHREMAMRPLMDLEAENLFEDLQNVYEQRDNPQDLRATALALLGEVDAMRAFPLLKGVFLSKTFDTQLRIAAATGLGRTMNPEVIDLLIGEYRQTDDGDLKEEIIIAIGSLKNQRAVEPLKMLRKSEKIGRFRELINDTLVDLEDLE